MNSDRNTDLDEGSEATVLGEAILVVPSGDKEFSISISCRHSYLQ